MTGEPAVRIEFLYWEECPSHDEALRRLWEVLQEERVDDPIATVRVDSEEQARALGFPGSPTIRFDGVDVQPEGAARARPALTCRAYVIDGRISPLPTKEMIRSALRKARGGA